MGTGVSPSKLMKSHVTDEDESKGVQTRLERYSNNSTSQRKIANKSKLLSTDNKARKIMIYRVKGKSRCSQA